MTDYAEIRSGNLSAYDSLAPEYEKKAVPRMSSARNRVAHLAGLLAPGATVFDVGCGVGVTIAAFRQAGFPADGIDLSPEMVKFSRRRNPGATIAVADVLEHSATELYDLVFAQALIHLFPPELAGAVLAALVRHTRPAGLVSVCTNHSDRSGADWSTKHDYTNSQPRFKHRWSRAEFLDLVTSAGLELVDERHSIDDRGKRFLEITARRE